MKLPPGWTTEDMMACAAAATPGKPHEYLAKGAGVWHAKVTMWMTPGAEPMHSECTSTVTMVMGGRYAKCETEGEMPGMGPYSGLGFYGFDNVQQKFVSSWLDNCSTGMMHGTGELSPDSKVMTYTYKVHCPLNKKVVPMREVETTTGENTKTLEMFSEDPKSGKEYRVMRIEMTRK